MVKTVGLLSQVDRAVVEEIFDENNSISPEPDGGRKNKRETRRVAKEVELVEFAGLDTEPLGLSLGCFVEQPLGEDVLGNENEGGEEGVENADELAAERAVSGAGKHNT